MANKIPGPAGQYPELEVPDAGTSALTQHQSPKPTSGKLSPTVHTAPISANSKILAATAYGEGSSKDVFEEMAAIANVLVRQQKARGYATIEAFIKADKTFAFAAHDGNQRYAKFMAATAGQIAKDTGMARALAAADNAIAATPVDYANGAYFWDGADIKSNYTNHAKVKDGIHFTKTEHNIYGIKDKDVPGEEWWRDAAGKKTKLRGKWTYKFESTAAFGGTIFWTYNADFLKATGNKEYK